MPFTANSYVLPTYSEERLALKMVKNEKQIHNIPKIKTFTREYTEKIGSDTSDYDVEESGSYTESFAEPELQAPFLKPGIQAESSVGGQVFAKNSEVIHETVEDCHKVGAAEILAKIPSHMIKNSNQLSKLNKTESENFASHQNDLIRDDVEESEYYIEPGPQIPTFSPDVKSGSTKQNIISERDGMSSIGPTEHKESAAEIVPHIPSRMIKNSTQLSKLSTSESENFASRQNKPIGGELPDGDVEESEYYIKPSPQIRPFGPEVETGSGKQDLISERDGMSSPGLPGHKEDTAKNMIQIPPQTIEDSAQLSKTNRSGSERLASHQREPIKSNLSNGDVEESENYIESNRGISPLSPRIESEDSKKALISEYGAINSTGSVGVIKDDGQSKLGVPAVLLISRDSDVHRLADVGIPLANNGLNDPASGVKCLPRDSAFCHQEEVRLPITIHSLQLNVGDGFRDEKNQNTKPINQSSPTVDANAKVKKYEDSREVMERSSGLISDGFQSQCEKTPGVGEDDTEQVWEFSGYKLALNAEASAGCQDLRVYILSSEENTKSNSCWELPFLSYEFPTFISDFADVRGLRVSWLAGQQLAIAQGVEAPEWSAMGSEWRQGGNTMGLEYLYLNLHGFLFNGPANFNDILDVHYYEVIQSSIDVSLGHLTESFQADLFFSSNDQIISCHETYLVWDFNSQFNAFLDVFAQGRDCEKMLSREFVGDGFTPVDSLETPQDCSAYFFTRSTDFLAITQASVWI
ncbi:hypothetical protein GNF76_28425 [Pseudomonas sp. CCM 7893]|uniref:Uncharacterized protein n=1 Tax=Pseudomonas spelaei TaxID=1055469 RepID=A0A6I3WDD5_9PSED|nr:hypothetical protein [Pseudomonas spelaei]MUF08265.1 hypothetical protein [Pseudomonas spelaei]